MHEIEDDTVKYSVPTPPFYCHPVSRQSIIFLHAGMMRTSVTQKHLVFGADRSS